ncbi:anthranilate synthase component I family protein [Planococcus sp. APC 4015]|nr:anthranilate synthase component I family protein [Planococcus sp. APC 4015]
MSDQLVPIELRGAMDPEAVFLSLQARHEHVFWLDAGPGATDGWSWVGHGEPELDAGRVRAVQLTAERGAGPGGRFRGGWVGWLGYEDAAARAGAPVAASGDDVPQERWIRAGGFVAFDHTSARAWAFAPASSAQEFAASVADLPPAEAVDAADPRAVNARHEPGQYTALVEECRGAIREGDAYQLCLTTRFDVAAPVDAVGAYRRLRSATPAHHGGLVVSGDSALASASPERFLEVEQGFVRTRPIKGTRPRGRDAAEDAALAAELVASEKERAENVMIVDLMRNDLSRVCVDGTVGVDALLDVETYPAVHQLVSTVSGVLTAGTTLDELLDAAFPAGSMTGAPKLSAMTILHRLEEAPRGVFAGAFGWVGDDGALDLAMVIRSVVVHAHGAYVGAGGGITWGSDAAAEVAEVGIKARGPLAAIGGILPPGW